MKVSRIGQSNNVAASAGTRGAGAKAKPGANDAIQLTSLSAHLAAAQSNSPERLAKLSELGAAVSGGSYQVDAMQVSGRIIEDSLSDRAA